MSIDRLDDSLVAAARDLYASGRQAFRHVTLPLTMPGIIAAAILTFIPAIGDYVTPDLLGGAQTTTSPRSSRRSSCRRATGRRARRSASC